jgi:hypothetical protein
MNDSDKKFEYYDDKRGAILYFIVMLIVDILLSLICFVQVSGVIHGLILLRFFQGIGFLYFLFLIYTAILCYRINKKLVRISKLYLVIRTLIMTCSIIILWLNNLYDKSMIGNGKKYNSITEFALYELMLPIIFVIITSGGWFLYFAKSKRCKEIAKGSVNI